MLVGKDLEGAHGDHLATGLCGGGHARLILLAGRRRRVIES
jgi:hypothetical protein